ncbi:Glucose 1-dehydrogenase [Acetobacteraceae bacterium EV16G]|uniref:Glucose 1-dehydrogenase n=1 Tax=Sorlinia euscelidii TaxID=3081148 RepID=A0ABU7U2P8_9PROT
MTQKTQPPFKGKTVLVTGASKGIGRQIALDFAAQGAQLAITARHDDELDLVLRDMKNATPGRHIKLEADLADEKSVRKVFEDTVSHFGGLDILICNAGMQIAAPSEDMKLDDFEAVLKLNLTAIVINAQQAIRYWRDHKKSGTIVVTSSVHQKIPKPGYLGYSASKGALGNVVRTLALEFAQYGIRVNGIAPGAIVTPMNEDWTKDPKKRKAVSSHIPMRRPGEASEISAGVLFLASDAASYITGQTLYVDGDLTLYRDFEDNWSS